MPAVVLERSEQQMGPAWTEMLVVAVVRRIPKEEAKVLEMGYLSQEVPEVT
jgi:hypothetical protein